MHADRDRNDDYYAKKSKKPDPYYQQQQQQNPGSKTEKSRYDRSYDNRSTRQGSEPRVAGNNNFSNNQDSMKNTYVNSDRNRDTRSSEPGGGSHYEQRNKPPSGPQRISNAALQRLPMNIDTLPPRLKKKFLLEAGLSEELANGPIMDMMQQSYSNTLPGRGRNNYQHYHHQGYQQYNKYNNNQNQGYQQNDRSITPPPTKSVRPPPPQPQKPPPPSRYDWKNNDIQRRDDSSPSNSKTTDSNFDWSEEVLNSQSLPHDVNSTTGAPKYDDNNRHRNRNRRRNRR